MITFKCPNCGAQMEFDPNSQQMHCDYCGTTTDLDEYNRTLQERGQFLATEYCCNQCGAVIMATDATAATFCSYCGSPVALTGNMTAQKAPKKIIPFKLDKDACMWAYEKKVRKAFFAPDWMLDPEAEQKFRGIYMPYFSHSFHGKSHFSGTAQVRYTSGKYDYEDTYELAAPVHASFSNIVGDASMAFPDTMSYNLGKPDPAKETDFKLSYLSGFYADLSDIREDRMLGFAGDLANKRMLSEKRASISISGHSTSINIGPAVAEMAQKGLQVQTKYVMNPVWFMSNRRGNKISYAAVDGADGDVAADIPIDFKKYLLVAMIATAVISLLLNLFNVVPTPENALNASVWMAIAGWAISGREYNKLWRRRNGYDDIGAMDDDTFLKVREAISKPVKKLMNRAQNARDRVGGKSGCLMVLLICAAIPLFPFLLAASMFLMPAFLVYAIIKGFRGGVKKSGIKKFKAPFGKRLLRAIPFVAVITTAISAIETYAENDTVQYAIAFAAIGINILMNFWTVRMQNDYAMRDIPVFTQKRGGDM